MQRVKGFTLIELMVTIAVLAIAISIAVPSFSNMIRDNRAESQSGAMVTALNLARSEAVKRGENITVSPTTGTNWSSGWEVKAGAEVIRSYPALQGATLSSAASSFVFNSRGRLQGVDLGTSNTLAYRVGSESCRQERDISVNGIGRVSVAKRSCS